MTELQQYLDREGMSAMALANVIGVTPSTITRLLRGERKASPELARRIEAATGIPRNVLRPDLYAGFVPVAPERAA